MKIFTRGLLLWIRSLAAPEFFDIDKQGYRVAVRDKDAYYKIAPFYQTTDPHIGFHLEEIDQTQFRDLTKLKEAKEA